MKVNVKASDTVTPALHGPATQNEVDQWPELPKSSFTRLSRPQPSRYD